MKKLLLVVLILGGCETFTGETVSNRTIWLQACTGYSATLESLALFGLQGKLDQTEKDTIQSFVPWLNKICYADEPPDNISVVLNELNRAVTELAIIESRK